MIHTLDTKAADYIPELGDGFEEGSEGSENAQGLQVADYYADADGEGIYYITYKIETAKEIEQLFVFAGRKQLLRLGKRKAGEVIEGTLYLHFGEMIPRFHSECMTITKIGFSVACEDLTKLKSVGMAAEKLSAKTKIPAIYLAGDSTVTDQTCPKPYMPGGCYSSWGQCLAYFIGESTAIDNQAHSGLTTETFRNEGHYDIVKKYIRPGDFCLFQFGHNDQKLAHLQAQTGYKENLMNYVNEIRGLCGVPILVTPLARNTWKDDGTYNDLLAEHAQAVFEVGEETGVPVIDLHKYAADLIKKNGKEIKISKPIDAMKNGIAYLPEDRKVDGIVGDLSVRDNIILAAQVLRGFFRPFSKAQANKFADEYIKLLEIKTASADTPIKSLSGGNQQKVILARWLLTHPEYLILDEPTRGIDIGTKIEIQKLVLKLASEGMSVTFISSETDEMLRTCSRLIVMRDRKKVGEITGEDLTQSKIMDTIAGGDEKNA